MVQVLPQVEGFGEKLANALSGAASNAIEGYQQKQEKTKLNAALKSLQDPNLTPIQKATAFAQLPESVKKSASPLFAAILGPQAQAEADTGSFNSLFGNTGVPGQSPGTSITSPPAGQQTQPGQSPAPGQETPSQPKQFDVKNPSSWSDQDIINLQGYASSKNPEFARLAASAKSEGERRKEDRVLKNQKEKEERDISAKRKQEERDIELSGAKGFYEKVDNDRIKLPEEEFANEQIIDSIKSGEIDPWSSAHIGSIARAFGVPEELTSILETPGSKEFNTARKTFIGSTIKDAFRGTTTTAELKLVDEMLAEVGVSKQANLASAWGLQSATEVKRARVRIVDELKEQGVDPSKIPAVANKMLEPLQKEIKREYFEAVRTLRKNGK